MFAVGDRVRVVNWGWNGSRMSAPVSKYNGLYGTVHVVPSENYVYYDIALDYDPDQEEGDGYFPLPCSINELEAVS